MTFLLCLAQPSSGKLSSALLTIVIVADVGTFKARPPSLRLHFKTNFVSQSLNISRPSSCGEPVVFRDSKTPSLRELPPTQVIFQFFNTHIMLSRRRWRIAFLKIRSTPRHKKVAAAGAIPRAPRRPAAPSNMPPMICWCHRCRSITCSIVISRLKSQGWGDTHA